MKQFYLLAATITLFWTYPYPYKATFNVYCTTNYFGPYLALTNGQSNVFSGQSSGLYYFVTNVAETNVTLRTEPGAHLFFVTATNETGESDPNTK